METFEERSVSEPIYPSRSREGAEPAPQAMIGQPVGAEANKGELLEIFWRGRWILVASVVVALGAAILYIQSATPLYDSSSLLNIQPNMLTHVTSDGNNTMMPQDAYYLQSQLDVIKSGAVLSLAADVLRQRHVRSIENSDSPVIMLKEGVSVELGKMTDNVTVTFEGPNPDEAAQAVNAVVEAYQTYINNTRRSTALDMLKQLESNAKQDLERRDKARADEVQFMKDNPEINLQVHGDTTVTSNLPTEVNGMANALSQAQYDLAQAQSKYNLAVDYRNDPMKLRQLMVLDVPDAGGASSDTPEVQQLKSYEVSLQAQLDDLMSRLGVKHPDVIRVQRQLERIKQNLQELGVADDTNGVASTEAQKHQADLYLLKLQERVRLAESRVKSLNEEFAKEMEDQKALAVNANNKLTEYELLSEEFAFWDKQCDQINENINKIHLTSDMTDSSPMVQILEVGKPSMLPAKPQRAKTIGIAVMMGLGLGLSLAFLNGWMDQRFRSAEDVSASLQLPILGAVPQISGREALNTRGQKAHLQPVSDFAEACRAIRTAIYFGMPDSQAKTLLVTSPLPGDGKSTGASNLAIVMAQAGQRTLVLDADYRRPNQHRIFEQDATIGSTNVLNGTATLDEAIKHTNIKGVDLLPCGPTPSHPAELLNSQAFADLLAELGKRYDHIVVDSPPVMPVTDARILGAICDATVFVVRAEKSTRKVSVFARDVLQSVGTNILGVMINGLSRGRGYYDAGYYQYGYGGKGNSTRKGTAVPIASDPVAEESMLTPDIGEDHTEMEHDHSDSV